MSGRMRARFWETKTLEEMTSAEWESLCDGCARCCVVVVELPEGEGPEPTSAACALLDLDACRCRHYADRSQRVPRCLVMTPERARSLPWLPPTCAYRLLAEGEALPEWHPLVSGDPESVERAGISMRGRLIDERHVHPEDLPSMRIRWR